MDHGEPEMAGVFQDLAHSDGSHIFIFRTDEYNGYADQIEAFRGYYYLFV